MKSKILRLLTFACFFQFSGINNGYTILVTASPINPRQSASCLSQTIKDIHATVGNRSAVPLLSAGQGWIVSFTLRSCSAMGGFFKSTPEMGQKTHTESRPGYQTRFEARATPSLINKESYLKFGKESWSKGQKDSPDMDLYLLGKISHQLISDNFEKLEYGDKERFDLSRKRFLSRRLGSSLNGDAAEKFNITRELA